MQAVAESVSRDLVLQSLSMLVTALSPEARLTVLSMHDNTVEVVASWGEVPLDDGAMLVSNSVELMRTRLLAEGPFFLDGGAPGLPPYGRDLLRLTESGAAFVAPLYAVDGVTEIVVVDEPSARLNLDEREYQLLCAAVSQASIAVANYDARILATKQELDTTRFLLSTADALAERRTLTDVLDALASSLISAIGHSRASVSLWDESRRQLTMASSTGESPVAAGTTLKLADASAPVRMAVQEKGRVLADYDRMAAAGGATGAPYAAHLALVQPVVYGDRLLGLIAVDDPDERREFADREISIAESLAAQAAVAIENARLFEAQQVELARTTLLKEIAAIGASSLTIDELAEPGLETIRSLLGASMGNLFVIDEARSVLRSVASFGVPQKLLDEHSEFPLDEKTTNGRAAVRGEVVVQTGRPPGELADIMRAAGVGPHTWISLPVTARERTLGTLGLAFEEGRSFTDAELSLLESVANQFGIAIQKAQLFEEEQRRTQRMAALRQVAELGVSLLDIGELAERLAATIAQVLDADRALVSLVDGDSGRLTPVGSHGWPEEFLAEMTPVPDSSPVMEAYATGEIQLVEDARDDDLSDALRARSERFGVATVAVVPLLVAGEPIGATSIAWVRPRVIDAEDSAFLESVAAAAAVGLQNSRLFETANRRAELEGTLVDVTAILASSMDIRDVMPDVLAKASGPLRASRAMLVLQEPGGWRASAVHGLPDDLLGEVYVDEAAPSLSHIKESQRPIFVPDVDEADSVVRAQAARMGYRSFISHPIMYRDEVVAAVSFFFDHPRSVLRDEESHFVARLAFMIGVTEENSRLYQAEHRIAETLQSALLAMPDPIEGIEFAHAYHSATEATRVGGDFYDIFEVGESRVGITIGDVAGKGLEAAALTSLVKNTIRAHATEKDLGPGEILELTNRVVYRSTPPEAFATVFFGILDRRDGVLHYSSAAHTTSAVLGPGASATSMRATGPLLGAFMNVTFGEAATRLGGGRMLFLYTDGLTEARHDGEFYSEPRLFDLLESTEWTSPEEVVSDVVADVIFFSHEQLRDDLAILVVACAEPKAEASEPADSGSPDDESDAADSSATATVTNSADENDPVDEIGPATEN